jgi:hypothetical protein
MESSGVAQASALEPVPDRAEGCLTHKEVP